MANYYFFFYYVDTSHYYNYNYSYNISCISYYLTAKDIGETATSDSGVFTIRPLRPCPPFEKYLGHVGCGPPWFLAIVISNLNYLLQVEHLIYRLK